MYLTELLVLPPPYVQSPRLPYTWGVSRFESSAAIRGLIGGVVANMRWWCIICERPTITIEMRFQLEGG